MKLKYLLAVLAYVVPSMLLAVPWHLMWFRDAYHEFGIYTRADPIIPLGMFTMILQGSVMAWFYPRAYCGGSPTLVGLKFGLLFGLFLFSVSTLANIAKIDVTNPGQFILLSGIFHTLQFGVAGTAIGIVFGRNVTPTSSPLNL